MNRLLTTLFLILFSASVTLNAQSAQGHFARIEGIVLEHGTIGTPVDYAMVSLDPSGVYTTTDSKGAFSFERVAPGKTTIKIQFVGMEAIDTTVNILPGTVHRFEFSMKIADFRLDEVVVIATQNKAGQATASNISRQAIDHMQASTLSDVLQLLPGQAMTNPSSSSANILTLRSLNPTSGNSSAVTQSNSLGTAVIIDGAQLSNNANMQTLSTTTTGNATMVGESSSYANTGVDTRTISLDNIESIEVIRGIASAEYGDMSSGAVIIKSKAGKEPLNIRFRTNPQYYGASISKGLSLGDKWGVLNLSGEYSYNNKAATESYRFYQNFTAKALWSSNLGSKFRHTTALDLIYGKDTRNLNPDDIRGKNASAATDLGLRFSSNGVLSIYKGWLSNIEYSVSGSYMDKHSWEEYLVGNGIAPHSINMINGSTITNTPGKKVYDKDGKEITNILSGSENAWTMYLPYEYFTHFDIYGKELNVTAKVKGTLFKSWGNVNNKIIGGLDFKTDGNLGRGFVYDDTTPPQRQGNYATFRPRPFNEVPFVNQFGIFLEDQFRATAGRHDMVLTAGARFDNVGGKNIITPRINAAVDIVPDLLTLKGGYGVAAKAPTALYLYPQNAYFDYLNLNTMTSENVDERLLIATTYVFNAENPDLKIQTRRTAEIGFDLKIKNRYRFSVTAYDALVNNGYMLAADPSTFHLVKFDQYQINSWTNGTPEIELANSANIFAYYSIPTNNLREHVRGIEYELDLGRFEDIRTSFYINGAYIRSSSGNSGYSFSTKENVSSNERHIGVYEKGLQTIEQELFNTTLRITHNIPRIGFVITLTTQVNWLDKAWYDIGNDEMFAHYISYKDGKMYPFDPSKKNDPEFSYLFESVASNRRDIESYRKTIFFNINVSKEIGDFLTASFYANNMFYSRPLHNSTKNPGTIYELGNQLFFGFDLKINIK